MDKAYWEDWCVHAFLDLAFSHFLLIYDDAAHPFVEYRGYFCQQSLEKFLKALLIKQNKLSQNDDLKQYNHELSKIIETISFNDNDRQRFFHRLIQIGRSFKDSFGQSMPSLRETQKMNFNKQTLDEYGDGIKDYSLYLAFLNAAYLEERYPGIVATHKEANTENLMVSANTGLLIATIRSCKLIIHHLGIEDVSPHIRQFTWHEQKSSFDDPKQSTISTYEDMERLVSYLMGDTDTLQLNQFAMVKNGN